MKHLKTIWQLCSYLFTPQMGKQRRKMELLKKDITYLIGKERAEGNLEPVSPLYVSRYADDLTFSSNSVEKLPKASFVRRVVEEEQLKLNFSKTGTYGRESRQSVTGILIDGDKPRVPQKFKRQIYRHLHFCEKFGPKAHFDHVMPDYANARKWLYGKILYVNAIEPDVAKDMLAKADALDWGVM